MIRTLQRGEGRCFTSEPGADELRLTDDLVWIDLIEPDQDEERQVEKLLRLDIPTRAEMREIETSSRLYEEDDALFMTATVIVRSDTPEPNSTPITFVLTRERLVTVRYEDPVPFRTFANRAGRMPGICARPETVLVNLLDAVVDRAADILEYIEESMERFSREIFAPHVKRQNYEAKLTELGRLGDKISRVRESLLSLARLGSFAMKRERLSQSSAAREMLAVLNSDIDSLNEHVAFLSQKSTFLLDATLGMIQIEQNTIIKIFSVVAVLFLPPTLIASIYGMNFQHMPELDWLLGYPLALGAMLASMLGFWLYFRWRGWM